MADEFVDFYQELDLPLEAGQKEVRQRINERYLEAQRNLDHRNFQTRVRYQQMFEVILPRARYTLLDENRRTEYDNLVRAFRAPLVPPPTPEPIQFKPSFGPGDASSFRLAEEEAAGKAPTVEPLPRPNYDTKELATQRDEMYAKWKSRLEAAIARDEERAAKQASSRVKETAETAPEKEAPRKQRANASPISFNFENGSATAINEEENARVAAFELERQRTERKRAAMREILDNVGLKGAMMGGFGAALPLGTFLIFLMGRFYPRDAPPTIALPSGLAWLLGLAVVVGITIVAALEMSKSARHKASVELSALPLEELLRRMGRTY